jgi:hypothetical protein
VLKLKLNKTVQTLVAPAEAEASGDVGAKITDRLLPAQERRAFAQSYSVSASALLRFTSRIVDQAPYTISAARNNQTHSGIPRPAMAR